MRRDVPRRTGTPRDAPGCWRDAPGCPGTRRDAPGRTRMPAGHAGTSWDAHARAGRDGYKQHLPRIDTQDVLLIQWGEAL